MVQCSILPVPEFTEGIIYMMPANSDMEYPPGTYAIFRECASGYQQTSGSSFRQCNDDGSWSGTQAVCSGELVHKY